MISKTESLLIEKIEYLKRLDILHIFCPHPGCCLITENINTPCNDHYHPTTWGTQTLTESRTMSTQTLSAVLFGVGEKRPAKAKGSPKKKKSKSSPLVLTPKGSLIV